MKTKDIVYSIVTLIFIVSILGDGYAVTAQGKSDWAPANPIPFYDDIYPPYLIADQNRTVHAFNSLSTGDLEYLINYRIWTIDQGWSKPFDIFMPDTSTRSALQGVVLDNSGVFHLIYFGGQMEDLVIRYSRAMATQANRAPAWSEPAIIANYAGPLTFAAITGDGDGNLTVVYGGQEDGIGVYEVRSEDGGNTWSEPTMLSLVRGVDRWPAHINLEMDSEGRLHAVWSIIGISGLGEEVYYSRRDLNGDWSEPYLMAAKEGLDYAADWASLVEHNGELIVMYMDGTALTGIPPTRWMRRSSDGGRTWSAPWQPFPHVGENGYAVLLVDSNDDLHVLLANRVGEPAIGGMWHAIWLGDRWSDLELVTAKTPQEGVASGAYADGNSASRPNAVISQGNVILSTWWHDMADQPPAAFSYITLDSPALPAVPLPTPLATPTPLETPFQATQTITPVQPSASSVPDLGEGILPVNTTSSPSMPILVGVISATVFIAVVIIVRRFFYRT